MPYRIVCNGVNREGMHKKMIAAARYRDTPESVAALLAILSLQKKTIYEINTSW
jgi:hypothetical protein